MSQAPERRIGIGRIIAYGLGDVYGGGAFLVIGMLFIFYLTEVVGLPAWTGGLIFGIGKVWDAISDPLMGRISDRSRTRMGRRRPWILAGVIPVFLSFASLWATLPAASDGLLVAYYAAAYIFFSTIFTMVMVPYSALNADMTMDYRIRGRLSGARMGFSMASALLAATLPRIIIDSRGSGAEGYGRMGLIFGAFYAVVLLPVALGTRELPSPEDADVPGGLNDLMKSFIGLARNRSFRLHMGMYICAYTAMDILMLLFAYYLKYALGRSGGGSYSLTMGVLMSCQILALAVWVPVSNRFGKGAAYSAGLFIWGTALILASVLGSATPMPFIVAVCALLGLGLSAGVFVPWAALPSVTDVGEYIDGERRSGLYAGAMTLARKTTQGLLAIPLGSAMLSILGFDNGASAETARIGGLRILFVAGSLPLIAAGIALARNFPITPATHRILRSEIDRRERAAAENSPLPEPDEETRAVLRRLTGR